MENTLYEINKHKLNIVSLSNKLFSTININEEIFINNELKKEVEFLSSLLNIKNNAMMNQMAMNNFNPMMNQNYAINNNNLQQLMQQQFMQMQQMMQQQQMQQEMLMNQQNKNIQKEKEISTIINVFFRKGKDKRYFVQCHFNEKIANVIKKYRNMTNDFTDTEKFIFNAKALNPSITVAEAGLYNKATIFVPETKGIIGG